MPLRQRRVLPRPYDPVRAHLLPGQVLNADPIYMENSLRMYAGEV